MQSIYRFEKKAFKTSLSFIFLEREITLLALLERSVSKMIRNLTNDKT